MSKRLVVGVMTYVLLQFPISTVLAQEAGPPVARFEISSGYAFMRDTGAERNYPAGWYVSAAGNVRTWLGVVVDASGFYTTPDFGPAPISAKAQMYTLLAGPRFFRSARRFVPFGQFLAGAAHWRFKANLPSPIEGRTTYRETWTHFAVQPGGGITMYVSPRVGVRAGADYPMAVWYCDYCDEEEKLQVESGLRVFTGLVVGWGER